MPRREMREKTPRAPKIQGSLLHSPPYGLMAQDNSSSNDLDDATVARLLTEDARASSARYAAQGLSALLPRRTDKNAPRPNTKFLKNLVRDADSHNAALRRREELERKERLRSIEDQARRRHREDRRDSKRRRTDDAGYRNHERDHDKRREGERTRHKRHSRNTSSESSRSRSPRRSLDKRPQRERSGEHRHRRQSPDSLEDERRPREHKRRRHRGSFSHSPQRSFHDAPNHSSTAKSPPEQSPSPRPASPTASHSSSDPLESIVGPLPASKTTSQPVRRRGRGAFTSSAMDAHFSSNYDPDLDVHPDSEVSDEREDWDMALEALRDRQAWKKKHAERMREAGFDDKEIQKWQESGREKGIEDVKWNKKGEAREWDVGKVDLEKETEPSPRKARTVEDGWKRREGGLLRGLKAALG